MPACRRPGGFPQRAHAHAWPADAADALSASSGGCGPCADLRLRGAAQGGAGCDARACGARATMRPRCSPSLPPPRRWWPRVVLPSVPAVASWRCGSASCRRRCRCRCGVRRCCRWASSSGWVAAAASSPSKRRRWARRIWRAWGLTRRRRSKASRRVRRCTARCCMTWRCWTRPMRRLRCWRRGSACARAIPASMCWCWNAPTCRPMRTRCVRPRACGCWMW